MSKPYLLISDTHFHSFSQFSTIEKDGVNSRLKLMLNELEEVVKRFRDEYHGELIVHCGDVSHKRGSIAPEVFNPVNQLFWQINCSYDMNVRMITGNHDISTNDTTELSSALTPFKFMDRTRVYHAADVDYDNKIVFCPWRHSREALLQDIKDCATPLMGWVEEFDLIIHAGITGVIPRLEHGFDPQTFRDFGFKRVFAGHYHCHRDLGGGIYSAGAFTQHDFGDVGTKAGYCLVYPDKVLHFETNAPKFIDVDEHTDKADIANNYCRLKLEGASQAEADKARSELHKLGAQGCIVSATPKAKAVRAASSVKATMSLQQSVQAYIDDKKDLEVGLKELGQRCEKILEETLAV